jgi:hypothetical protein
MSAVTAEAIKSAFFRIMAILLAACVVGAMWFQYDQGNLTLPWSRPQNSPRNLQSGAGREPAVTWTALVRIPPVSPVVVADWSFLGKEPGLFQAGSEPSA